MTKCKKENYFVNIIDDDYNIVGDDDDIDEITRYDMLKNMDPPLGFGSKCPDRLAYKKLIRQCHQ